MKKKKNNLKILRIITSLNPKYGGPAHGIIESSKDLITNGHDVTILTLDKNANKQQKIKGIKIKNFEDYMGKNYRFSLNFLYWLYKNYNSYNFVIIHGLWQFPSLAARFLLNGNYFIFTHGQLDPFFSLNWSKKIKKQLYWYLIEKKNLLKAKSIILTSEGEKFSLKKSYVDCAGINKKVINYGINKPNFKKNYSLRLFYKRFPIFKNNNFFLFLGRFHEKKGCEILIKSVLKLKDKFRDHLLLAGPGYNEKYHLYLKVLVKKYKLENKILFSDALYKEIKWGSILACKGMVLSSHGENFGISLVEALSLGKPVITTNKVNISKDISIYKAGLISSNTVSGFSKNLLKFNNLSEKKRLIMSKQATKCFNKKFNISLADNSLTSLLENSKI